MTKLHIGALWAAATTLLLISPVSSNAYEFYSDAVNDVGQCAACHGKFREGNYFSEAEGLSWGDTLHAVHLDNTDVESNPNGGCDNCHDGVGTVGRTVNLSSSANAKDGVNAIACMGCHGRLEDANNLGFLGENGWGAGLRQHHENSTHVDAGAGTCSGCHPDANPANFTPASEDTMPPWYSSVTNTSIAMTMNPCSVDGEEDYSSNGTGIDNDGDQVYDVLDSGCAINTPPVADAGVDQTVDVGETVTLDGGGSTDADSDPLTYSWTLSVPGGSVAVLSDATAVGPTFVPDVDGTYTATLVVNDGTDDSAPNDAIITAQVVVVNIPPVANAGSDQNIDVGDTVNLNGSGSSDADGDALTYLWSLSAPGGSGATLSSTTAASPTFVADVAGDYVVQLIVNDGTEDSAADSAVITAQVVVVNNPPVANAGLDENVTVSDTVTLDGSGSTDADGDALTYLWSLSIPGGSGATLSDATAVSPTFVADVAGDYVAQLIVNDGMDASAADTATITASAVPVNNPPVADAGLDQSVLAGATVTLDASGSSDADGDALTYSWSLSVPAGSGATLTDPTAIIQNFVADVDGDYVAQLIVNDGVDNSTPDSVVIMAALPAANQPPVANAGPDQAVVLGATVTLDGSGSSDPDVDPLTYSWSVTSVPAGSGATLSDATAIDPSLVADLAGDYVLQLMVNDGEFDSAPDTVMVTVVVAAPPVSDPSGPYSGFTNEAITFDGRGSSDPDGGAIQSWNWDFGDGSTGTGETVTHIFGAIGTYDVQLTVTDDEGQTSTTVMTTATVQDRPVVKRKSGGGAISLTFLWLLGFAALLSRRRSIGLRRSVGKTSGS